MTAEELKLLSCVFTLIGLPKNGCRYRIPLGLESTSFPKVVVFKQRTTIKIFKPRLVRSLYYRSNDNSNIPIAYSMIVKFR